MRIDLEGGAYYDEENGFGLVTNMYDANGEETIDPRQCFAAVVRFSPSRWLSVEVLPDERKATVN